MTQEEKSLLLKNLCTRLPYRVKCRIKGKRSKILIGIDPKGLLFRGRTPDKSDWCYNCYDIEEWSILPYLRPMSSMTKEELHEVQEILGKGVEIREDFILSIDSSINSFTYLELQAVFDWLNAHHFDYIGLIKRGLALEAHEGMYN